MCTQCVNPRADPNQYDWVCVNTKPREVATRNTDVIVCVLYVGTNISGDCVDQVMYILLFLLIYLDLTKPVGNRCIGVIPEKLYATVFRRAGSLSDCDMSKILLFILFV
ncbi:hypothetical protein RF55_10749 [Lasius niger]|uniref:Uncharacterized protein n=1 Tax=Lasius niger TaxID=67767 RepID=A0A0J7KHA1_LASNI|nr:hypothetical protein RF55_10749 [Lasius niger]